MIEVKTIYDINTQKRATKLAVKMALRTPAMLVFPAFLLLGVLCCVLSRKEEFASMLRPGIGAIAFAVLFPFFIIFLCWIAGKATAKNNKFIHEPMDTYFRFEEQQFVAESTRDGQVVAMHTVRYTDLYRVIEMKNDFLIYINTVSLQLVPKSDFTQGNPQQLSILLKGFLGKKYKLKLRIK